MTEGYSTSASCSVIVKFFVNALRESGRKRNEPECEVEFRKEQGSVTTQALFAKVNFSDIGTLASVYGQACRFGVLFEAQ